ncbi:MAG: hypothetical protein QXT91_00790 [Candidatus Caldarchaeum sp.]
MRILYIRPDVGLFEACGVPRPRREDGGLTGKQQEVLRLARSLEQEFLQEAEELLGDYGVKPVVGARTSWRDDGRGDPREVVLGIPAEALIIRAELSVELTRRVLKAAKALLQRWAAEETLQSRLEAVLSRLEEEDGQ